MTLPSVMHNELLYCPIEFRLLPVKGGLRGDAAAILCGCVSEHL